jgi:hypothetical protein
MEHGIHHAVEYVSFGLIDRAEYEQLCDTYGADVTTRDVFAVFRDIRELRMTCYIAQQAAASPSLADETRLRTTACAAVTAPPLGMDTYTMKTTITSMTS